MEEEEGRVEEVESARVLKSPLLLGRVCACGRERVRVRAQRRTKEEIHSFGDLARAHTAETPDFCCAQKSRLLGADEKSPTFGVAKVGTFGEAKVPTFGSGL